MKKLLVYLFSVIIIAPFGSCKKKDNDSSEATDYTYEAFDSLIFEHTGQLDYSVKINTTSNKECFASLSEVNGAFSLINNDVIIPPNESRNIVVKFNQYNVLPNLYPCKLNVTVPNENNSSKSKTLWLIYRPNCAYNFRNYINGNITYIINGILTNKTISCNYNNEGQLEVIGLTPFTITLNFNCDSNTVSMKQLTYLGYLVTGSGTISSNQIHLQFFDDGVLNSEANIKP